MDLRAIHDQLDGSEQGDVLLAFLEVTGGDRKQVVANRDVAELTELDQGDVQELLSELRELSLIKGPISAAGGWKLTLVGARAAQGFRESLESGPLWFEKVAEKLLRGLLEAGESASREQWETWDLHEQGRPAIDYDTRLEVLEALANSGYIGHEGSNADRFDGVWIESKGRQTLRSNGRIFPSMHRLSNPAMTNQHIGILATNFTNDHGVVQAGEHNVQHVTMTDERMTQIQARVEDVRRVLEDANVDANVRDQVGAEVDQLDQAVRDGTDPGLIGTILAKAMTAAASSAGTAGGAALIQSLARVSEAVVGT